MLKKIKRFLVIGLVAIALIAAGLYYWLFMVEGKTTEIYKLVPEDAIFIGEVDKPLDKWDEFKEAKVWQFLQNNQYMGGVNEMVEDLRGIIESNRKYLKLFTKGKLLMSGHLIGNNDYSYLYLIDIGNTSKLGGLKGFMDYLISQVGYKSTKQEHRGQTIYGLHTGNPNDALYVSIKDNVLLYAYYPKIIKAALDQHEKPHFTKDQTFLSVKKQLKDDVLTDLYINYKYLKEFVQVYVNPVPSAITSIEKMMDLSGMQLNVQDDFLELRGMTDIEDEKPSVLQALRAAGSSEIQSHKILPANTTTMVSLGFRDFDKLHTVLQAYYKEVEKTSMKSKLLKLQQYVRFDFDEDIKSWMGKEFTYALIPSGAYSVQTSVLIIPAGKNIGQAKDKIGKVGLSIAGLNLKLFRKKKYRDVEIQRFPIKGLFPAMFGGFLKSFDRPSFAFIGEYVVFSETETGVQRIIDAWIDDKTLSQEPHFEKFFEEFDRQNSVFAFGQTKYLYSYLLGRATPAKRAQLAKNRKHFLGFPRIGFQLSPDGELFETLVYAEFDPSKL